MKHLRQKVFILCCGAFLPIAAQQVVATAGGDGSSGSAKISWTLCELATESYSAANATITQGQQQSTVVVTEIEQVQKNSYQVEAFPNPATNVIRLSIKNEHLSNVSFILFDISGRILEQKKVISSLTEIPFAQLIPETYLLKVFENNTEIKTFKIIKK